MLLIGVPRISDGGEVIPHKEFFLIQSYSTKLTKSAFLIYSLPTLMFYSFLLKPDQHFLLYLFMFPAKVMICKVCS
jgi:hypothetical protein